MLATAEWRAFRGNAIRFVALAAAFWLGMAAVNRSLPYLKPGADIVTEKKFSVLAHERLFGPDDKFRVVAFGNSRTMAGLVPHVFDTEGSKGTKFYNFGLPGETNFLPILEAVLAAGNNPNYVLLQLPWDPAVQAPTFWSFLPSDRELVDILVPFRTLPRNLFILLAQSIHTNPIAVYRSAEQEANLVLRDDGYYFIRSQSHFPNDQLPSDYSIATDRPEVVVPRPIETSGYQFKQLLSLAQSHGFKVVLIPSALRIGEAAAPPEQRGLRPIPEAPGFFELGPQYVLYPPPMFADPVHLNPQGALVYSQYLAKLFRENVTERSGAL